MAKRRGKKSRSNPRRYARIRGVGALSAKGGLKTALTVALPIAGGAVAAHLVAGQLFKNPESAIAKAVPAGYTRDLVPAGIGAVLLISPLAKQKLVQGAAIGMMVYSGLAAFLRNRGAAISGPGYGSYGLPPVPRSMGLPAMAGNYDAVQIAGAESDMATAQAVSIQGIPDSCGE